MALGRVPILGDFLANLIGYQTSDDLLNLFGQLNINDIDLIDSIECETFIDDPNMNSIMNSIIRWSHPYEYTKEYAERLANHKLFKNTDKVFFEDELISNKDVKQNSMVGNNSVDKQLNTLQNFGAVNNMRELNMRAINDMSFGAVNNMRELNMRAINDMSFGAINNNMRGLTMGDINKIREQLNNDKKSAEGANNNKKQDSYRLCSNQISKHRKKPETQISPI